MVHEASDFFCRFTDLHLKFSTWTDIGYWTDIFFPETKLFFKCHFWSTNSVFLEWVCFCILFVVIMWMMAQSINQCYKMKIPKEMKFLPSSRIPEFLISFFSCNFSKISAKFSQFPEFFQRSPIWILSPAEALVVSLLNAQTGKMSFKLWPVCVLTELWPASLCLFFFVVYIPSLFVLFQQTKLGFLVNVMVWSPE